MPIGERIAELGVSHVPAGGADHLGIWRAKRVLAEAAARGALGFSDGVFGLDITGEWVAPPAGHAGWYPSSDTGGRDRLLALDPETADVCPWLGGDGWVLGNWTAHRCVLPEAEAEAARVRVSDADRRRYFELA